MDTKPTLRETLNGVIADVEAREASHVAELITIRERTTHTLKGTVEVRTCQECRQPYPEWTALEPPSTCPSCILLSSVPAQQTGGGSGRALRHDTPPEVGAAAVIHEALRDYAALTGLNREPTWEESPGWLRAWKIEIVRAVKAGVVDPERVHAEWVAAREKEGWKYGAVTDPIKRLAPQMHPWNTLGPIEQTKLRLAVAIAGVLG